MVSLTFEPGLLQPISRDVWGQYFLHGVCCVAKQDQVVVAGWGQTCVAASVPGQLGALPFLGQPEPTCPAALGGWL